MSFFDSEQKNEFEPIPEGNYQAVIFNVDCDLTKNPPTVSVQYKLENNRRVFQNFRFDDKGKKWIVWQMGELGLNEAAKRLLPHPTQATPHDAAKSYVEAARQVLNKVVGIEITHREYNGKKYESVKIIDGLGATTTPTPLTKTSAAPKFDANEPLPF